MPLPKSTLCTTLALSLAASHAIRAAELFPADDQTGTYFGGSISQSGSNVLVGAGGTNFGSDSNLGVAYLYLNVDAATDSASNNARLFSVDFDDYSNFGVAVSLDGDNALVGATGKVNANNQYIGSVYVFHDLTTANGDLSSSTRLTASSSGYNDAFGRSVSLSGSNGLVGAYSQTVGENSFQGAVYLYHELDTISENHTEQAILTASDGVGGEFFGYSTSLSGGIGLIGAQSATVGGKAQQGAAYIFRNLDTASGNLTEAAKLIASDGSEGSYFGHSVSLSGNNGLVGAISATTGADSITGEAYLYRNLDTATGTTTEDVRLLASDPQFNGRFGNSVSLSGNDALVGATRARSGDETYNGAAYLYRGLDTATGTVTETVKITSNEGPNFYYFGTSVSLSGDQFTVGAQTNSGNAIAAYTGSVSSLTTLDTGDTSKTISGISFTSQTDWIIGQTTSGNQVTLAAGSVADISAAGRGIYIGQTSNSNYNSLIVGGTVTTNSVTIGSEDLFGTHNSGNRLLIDNDGGRIAGKVIASDKITIYASSNLALNGNSDVNDRVGNETKIVLAGGTFLLDNLSEGAAGLSGVGQLILLQSSNIDFGPQSIFLRSKGDPFTPLPIGNLIQFSGVGSNENGQTLSIDNWEGTLDSGDGADRLLFAGLSDEFTEQYTQDQVTFNDSPGYATYQYDGYYEVGGITPVPEANPGLLVSTAALILGGAALRRRQTTA